MSTLQVSVFETTSAFNNPNIYCKYTTYPSLMENCLFIDDSIIGAGN